MDGGAAVLARCPVDSWSVLAHEVIYLCGYVVECSFKALILTRTPPRKHGEQVEEFRTEVKHNLDKLRHLLSLKGVELPPSHRPRFVLVRSEWNSEMRYDPQRRGREDAAAVWDAARHLHEWADRV